MATNATNAAKAKGAANAAATSVLLSVAPNAAMLMAKPAWRTIMVTAEAMPACVGDPGSASEGKAEILGNAGRGDHDCGHVKQGQKRTEAKR